MKKIKLYLLTSTVLLSILSTLAFKAVDFEDIKGWYLTGSNPDCYQIDVVKDPNRNGNVGHLKSIKEVKGFGTIMQGFSPANYLGKRVRLTGFIKSKDVKDWAGLWFRIDGPDKKPVSFDNMQKRAIKGTTGWQKYEIVLDAPENSAYFAYGVLLSGSGEVWLDDLTFEVVDKNVPLTDIISKNTAPTQPENSSFEETK